MIREGYPPGFVDLESLSDSEKSAEEGEEEPLRFICGGEEMDLSDDDEGNTNRGSSKSGAATVSARNLGPPRKAVMTVVFPGAFGAPPPPGADARLWDLNQQVHTLDGIHHGAARDHEHSMHGSPLTRPHNASISLSRNAYGVGVPQGIDPSNSPFHPATAAPMRPAPMAPTTPAALHPHQHSPYTRVHQNSCVQQSSEHLSQQQGYQQLQYPRHAHLQNPNLSQSGPYLQHSQQHIRYHQQPQAPQYAQHPYQYNQYLEQSQVLQSAVPYALAAYRPDRGVEWPIGHVNSRIATSDTWPSEAQNLAGFTQLIRLPGQSNQGWGGVVGVGGGFLRAGNGASTATGAYPSTLGAWQWSHNR
jgi:hypothetical protein